MENSAIRRQHLSSQKQSNRYEVIFLVHFPVELPIFGPVDQKIFEQNHTVVGHLPWWVKSWKDSVTFCTFYIRNTLIHTPQKNRTQPNTVNIASSKQLPLMHNVLVTYKELKVNSRPFPFLVWEMSVTLSHLSLLLTS